MNKTALVLLLVALSAPTQAVNWRWLEYSPVESFTEQDWELMMTTATQALDDLRDGESRDWSNAESGNRGAIKILASETTSTGACRTARIRNTSAASEGQSTFRLCRRADGSWRIANPVRGGENGAHSAPGIGFQLSLP
jgi:hypothetical protein